MKLILLLWPVLVSIVLAAPQKGGEGDAVITKFNNDNIGVDGYNFDFDTSNGISRQEQGKLNNAGSEKEAMEVAGAFSSPVGNKKVSITFVADENGYRPKVLIE